MVKVETLSRKLIKPSTPTPEDLNKYKISFIDECFPTANIIITIYYDKSAELERKLDHIEQSLARVLSYFYPFAGRYMKDDRNIVYCNDKGVEYIKAQALDLELAQITARPDSEVKAAELYELSPREVGESDEENDPILSVKITKFKCGGIAMGVALSHRIGDASSLGLFLSAWSRASKLGLDGEIARPTFDGPRIFPGKGFQPADDTGGTLRRRDDIASADTHVAKLFVFDRKAISKMRDHCLKATEVIRRPSRVGLVGGLILKAITNVEIATDRNRHLFVAQPINLRGRTAAVPEHDSVGNFLKAAITHRSGAEARDMGFEDFVRAVGDDVRCAVEEIGRVAAMDSEEGHDFMLRYDNVPTHLWAEKEDSVNRITITDWSKFEFYEADFGWGKPIWTSMTEFEPKSTGIVLLGDRDGGGIEAWVQMLVSDMALFERDELLTKFLTSN